MMNNNKFVNTVDELIYSTIKFYSKPGFWKAVLGTAPKYFVHYQDNEKHIFGLSKFCALKNITVEAYLSGCRRKADGEKAQKHIALLTAKNWIPRNKVENNIRQSFDNWIFEFFPNYKLDNASFISINK